MAKKHLKSVREIVDALGGYAAVARWANTYPSTVCNWLAADEIPNGWHYRLHIELERRGFRVDPQVFIRVAPATPKKVHKTLRSSLAGAGRNII